MGLKDDIRRSMGPLEKLAALKLWWWAQREVPKMLGRMFGNKVTTSVGALIVLFETLCHGGVLPPTWCALEVPVVSVLAALGLFSAKDAVTGSEPGARG